jgi:lipoprotein-anchoring transpeptidase ErfK/SrfK
MSGFLKAACASIFLLVQPMAASAAQLIARVDVSSQTMTVSYGGEVLHNWAVSTGRKGFYTPRGAWRPQRMATMWRSRKYDNAPMPYSVFFTGGFAVHGTSHVKSLGRPASHGCVRLQTKNAARFYALVQQVGRKNTKIVISN